MTANKRMSVVPNLRFPEFQNTQAWSLRPLGKVLAPIVREREKPTIPYTGLGIRSHGRGTFRKELQQPEKTSMTRLYEVDRNDLIVNITFAWEGAIAIVRPEDTGALVSHRFPTYQFDQNEVLPEFFRYPILDKQFIYNLGVISPGGAGRNRVLNKSDFLKIELALPEVVEQRKIADCLGSLDDLIAAEDRKLEALRQHKQGLMQQLFPQPGETVPQLRFAEFRREGDWRRDRLGNVASITKGRGISKADITVDGATPCIRYAEIYTRYGEVIHEVVSQTNLPHEKLVLSETEDVIIPASGESRADIAKAACVLAERVALGSDLNILRSELYGPFFSYLLNSPLRETIARVAQGDTVAHLYPKQLSQVWLVYPLRLEQRRIADCLASLDDLIAAVLRKLEALRQHKQGLMQQMFPTLER